MDAPDAVIFDMGGVIVELGPLTDILGDDPLPVGEFWAKWLASPTVRAFEMGRCSAEEFGRRLVVELNLSFDGHELVERFLAWPKGLYPGSVELIDELAGRAEVGILSNTNALHWSNQVDHDIVAGLFTRHYLSFQLGLAKPDADIFAHVIADLDRPADRILFLDDNQINVDGARAAGMRSALVRGPGEARAALVANGVLAPMP